MKNKETTKEYMLRKRITLEGNSPRAWTGAMKEIKKQQEKESKRPTNNIICFIKGKHTYKKYYKARSGGYYQLKCKFCGDDITQGLLQRDKI